jgi:hypothetical protein
LWWYLIVILICIPLMTDDAEHNFICLFSNAYFCFAVCLPSEIPLCVFCPFPNWNV